MLTNSESSLISNATPQNFFGIVIFTFEYLPVAMSSFNSFPPFLIYPHYTTLRKDCQVLF